RDAVPTEDVRIAIVSRRLAAAEDNSVKKQKLERELAQLYNDRSIIASRIEQIASKALSINRGGYLEIVTEKHMKLTKYDCYQSVTEHIHEKCFDLQGARMREMENELDNQFHFNQKNYFLRFQSHETESSKSTIYHVNKHVRHALEYFVDDLKLDQNKTIERFLNEKT
ncbi:unnamed protein product, partial [Rotaria magnacalcarata]